MHYFPNIPLIPFSVIAKSGIFFNSFERMRDTGLMKRSLKKWWGPPVSCDDIYEHKDFHEMGLLETGSAFAVLVAGAVLPSILVCAECVFHAIANRRGVAMLYLGDFKEKPKSFIWDAASNAPTLLIVTSSTSFTSETLKETFASSG